MLFDAHVYTAEMPALLARAVQIATPAACRRRTEAFASQIRANPLITHYVNERFPIERAWDQVLRYKNSTGRLPSIVDEESPALHRLFAFAAMAARVHHRLSPRGQKTLAGRIRGGLTDDNGLASLAYEMQIAAHLMLQGFDVIFHDIENGGGFDFLASRDGLEIEVECKAFSGDIGRKIHLRRQYQLGGLIYPALASTLKNRGSTFIEITLPKRLNGSDLPVLADLISGALREENQLPGPSPCSLRIEPFSIGGSPFNLDERPPKVNKDDIASFVQEQFGTETQNYLLLMSRGAGAVIVALTSRQPDGVLKGIYKQLKSAADQLSGGRPGFICGHFLDMAPDDLLEISEAPKTTNKPTGLHIMMTAFFRNVQRSHVHTVKFSTPGILRTSRYVDGDMLKVQSGEQGPAFVLTNKAHPLADDDRLRVFT
jgi:hypothetical protein